MLCLHCSPPTSDPRAPEQREPHSLLTDINWAPRGLQRLSGNRWPPAGQPPKSHRRQPCPSPEIREPRHPRSRHSPRDGPSARATTERRTGRRTRRVRSSPSASRAENRQQRDSLPHPAATTAPPETPAATLRYLTKHGEEPPVLTSRPTFASGWPQLSEFTREILGRPAGEGPSSTALDGVCVDASAPPGNTFCTKGSSGTCSACKGHRPCIKAGATKRVLLAPGILSALLHQRANAQRLQRGTSSRQAQLQPNSPL